MSEISDRQLKGFSILLQLQRQAREAESVSALSFLIVNNTRELIEYRQGALWAPQNSVLSLSGVTEVNIDAPYVQWLNNFFKDLDFPEDVTVFNPNTLSSIQMEWEEWLPKNILLLPLRLIDPDKSYVLLLAREKEWEQHEIALLQELLSAYKHAMSALIIKQQSWRLPLKSNSFGWKKSLIIGCLVLAGFIPIRLSVLAPAEIIPQAPSLVRSPIDGVIEEFYVSPNEPVKQGQLLFELDSTSLESKLFVSTKALEVARAEYRQSAQQALYDESNKVAVAIRQGIVEQKAEQVAHLQKLLSRTTVTADSEGVAIFSDVSDWVGRAVVIGEGILTIADPEKIELQIKLPVSDAIALDTGAQVKLFLKMAPHDPVSGVIYYNSYRAEESAEGILAYRLKSNLIEADIPLRIGMTGTAKLYGEQVSLAYYLFRRPLAAVRQWFGW